jgi:hypothetical protein
MMATEYRTVDTSTLEGLRKAERLKAHGWIIYSVGLFLVGFYRRRPHKAARRG